MNGLLLINLGTPDAPTTSAVRRYLREFLSDPRVLDMPAISRKLLLNLIILPRRSHASAEAYAKIWDEERGSPLAYHGADLQAAVQQRLGESWLVRLAMRYGQPSIKSVVSELRDANVNRLVVLPLYPQYAVSTTESSIAELKRHGRGDWDSTPVHVAPPFYSTAQFLSATAAIAGPALEAEDPDHILFSFHGLPERHILRDDSSKTHCLKSDDCCSQISEVNQNCYRAQCMETARLLAQQLDLPADLWSVSFQSRLGKAVWIGPDTEKRIIELAQGGVERLAVMCPAFVADCLETLEEIGIRGSETFTSHGGGQLTLIPSLNSSAPWVDAVADLARAAAHSPPSDLE